MHLLSVLQGETFTTSTHISGKGGLVLIKRKTTNKRANNYLRRRLDGG